MRLNKTSVTSAEDTKVTGKVLLPSGSTTLWEVPFPATTAIKAKYVFYRYILNVKSDLRSNILTKKYIPC